MPISQVVACPLRSDSCSLRAEVDAAKVEVGVVENLSVGLEVTL